jgi:hypothetical protein
MCGLKFWCEILKPASGVWNSLILTYIVYLMLWIDFLSIHAFVKLFIVHLENIGSLTYTSLPNIDIFLLNNIKDLLTSSLISSEKSLSIGKLSSSKF